MKFALWAWLRSELALCHSSARLQNNRAQLGGNTVTCAIRYQKGGGRGVCVTSTLLCLALLPHSCCHYLTSNDSH